MSILLLVTLAGGEAVDFSRDVRPLLNEHCTACHGGVKQAGGVSFVTSEAVLPPDGWVVEPGDPDASVLIERVTSEDPDVVMPPPEEGRPLSDEEVDLLRRWIEQGAEWEKHWSFVPPERPDPPAVADGDWPRSGLDRFVLARLDEEGITPSREADADRWLRRVSLSLTGLPPSPGERASFLERVADDRDAAYAEAVDRLLASPHFGERWASVWLDQVRYADSEGLGLDRRRSVWKYRDWVVGAFNRDMPYDEFTRKQIAGDLLPNPTTEDLVATTGQRLTQTNAEGGTDDEEFRTEAVIDRVNTTWQTWQALTFGCTQCHSHPYDPVTQTEYYEFLALFNNTADSDTDNHFPTVRVPTDPADYAKADELRARARTLKRSLWADEYAAVSAATWRDVVDLSGESRNASPVRFEPVDGGPAQYVLKDTSRNTRVMLDTPVPDGLKRLTGVRFTGMPLDVEKAVQDSEWGFALSRIFVEVIPADPEDPRFDRLKSERAKVEAANAAAKEKDSKAKPKELPRGLRIARVVADEAEPYYDPADSLRGNGSGWGPYSRIHHPRSAVFVLAEPFGLKPTDTIRVELQFNQFILASFVMAAKRGALEVSGDRRLTQLVTKAEWAARRLELTDAEKELRKIPAVATPVLRERDDRFARPTHLFDRGNFLTKAEAVGGGLPDELAGGVEAADRLELANWLVSKNNPLTDRVMVNRLWARLFGTGLVRTEEDFGSSGERPSHPELLDWLAVRFRDDHGRRVKPLLREIVLSATYRQSADASAEVRSQDPENRLLSRGPRFRLPAETVRDQALAVAGLLSDKVGGPPVQPPIPDGVWKPFSDGPWRSPAAGDPDRYRRSLYTYTKRSIPYPMFAAFDSPNREFCTPRRLRSNTPLQSLMTLNDATFEEAAAALGTLIRDDGVESGIRAGVLRATARTATDAEVATLRSLHDRVRDLAGDGAAWTEVARVLLNLDELFVL